MVKRINLILNDDVFHSFLLKKERAKKKLKTASLAWEDFFIFELGLK